MRACDGHRAPGLPWKQQAFPTALRRAQRALENMRRGLDLETHCYGPVDKLLARQGKIRKALASKRLGEGCLVLYDITSSCMEGCQAHEDRMAGYDFFHKPDPRIERHEFICMLACYLMWHMDQRLQPLNAQDGVGGKRKYTFGCVIESLKAICENIVSIESVPVPVVTAPNSEQEFILFLLENLA